MWIRSTLIVATPLQHSASAHRRSPGAATTPNLGAAHEAFAVRPGSFNGCRLRRKARRSGTKPPLVHQ
jgi:hypothetical protein